MSCIYAEIKMVRVNCLCCDGSAYKQEAVKLLKMAWPMVSTKNLHMLISSFKESSPEVEHTLLDIRILSTLLIVTVTQFYRDVFLAIFDNYILNPITCTRGYQKVRRLSL